MISGIFVYGLLLACFVTFVVITVTLVQAAKNDASDGAAALLSPLGWVIASVLAFVLWIFLSFILNVGHNTGATGLRGALGNIVFFGGPALYLYVSSRQYTKARLAMSK